MALQLVPIILSTVSLYFFIRFIQILWKMKKISRAVDQFPMDEKHWLKGHLNRISGAGEKTFAYLLEMVDRYPKACGFYYVNFVKPCVVVHHPETVKAVIKGTHKKALVHGGIGFVTGWLGDGLLVSSGSKWLRNRRLLTPTFHFDALKQYAHVDNQVSDYFLAKLAELAQDQSYFDIYRLVSLLTSDVILKCAFSHDFKAQIEGEDHYYVRAVDQLTKLWMKRYFDPWVHADFIYWRTKDGKEFIRHCNTTREEATKLINERKKLIKENPEKAKTYIDFLNILLMSKDEDGTGLTDDEVIDEINTFIFAGFETTATAISWALYTLAKHPKHMKLCQNEIDNLMKGRTDDYINWNDLPELPYLTMCLKESMRINGIPAIERELHEDLVIDGKKIPVGTLVMISLYGLHHNPAVWENPFEFDPERFSPERISKVDVYGFIPFSAGSRNCIGQNFALEEAKIILARTLKRFDVHVKDDHVPHIMFAATMKSENGIYLKLSKRKNH